MDTTIDQLLAMSTDNENEKIRSEIEQSEDPAPDKPVEIPELSKSLRSIHKWQPPLLGPLPDTFLRLPRQWGEGCETTEGGSTLEGSMLEDERIAIFLQNEEFMAELRWNEDFLSTLASGEFIRTQKTEKRKTQNSPFSLISDTKLEECEKSAGAATHDDEDLFKERLRNMGKGMKE